MNASQWEKIVNLNRRTIAQGIAWAIPSVIVVASAPALAASPACNGHLIDSGSTSLGMLVQGGETTRTLNVNPQYACAGNCHGFPPTGEIQIVFQFSSSDYSVGDPAGWLNSSQQWEAAVSQSGGVTSITLTHPSLNIYGMPGFLAIPLTLLSSNPQAIQSATIRGCFNNLNVWNNVRGS